MSEFFVGALCIVGIVFFIVAVVSLVYLIVLGKKFKDLKETFERRGRYVDREFDNIDRYIETSRRTAQEEILSIVDSKLDKLN